MQVPTIWSGRVIGFWTEKRKWISPPVYCLTKPRRWKSDRECIIKWEEYLILPHTLPQYSRNVQVSWFSTTNHNSLLRIATNEIALFCRQQITSTDGFCRVYQSEQTTAFEVIRWKILNFLRRSLILCYIKQIDSMLPWPHKTSKCGKNISDTLGYRLECKFFVLTTFWLHLWSITEQTHGNMESICQIDGELRSQSENDIRDRTVVDLY